MKKNNGVVVVVAIAALIGCNDGGGKGRGSTAAAVGTRVLAGTLVEARAGHTATALADAQRVLIAGGMTPRAPVSATAEVWEAGQSRPLAAMMTVPRAGHRAVLLPGGEVWIVGGHDATGAALVSTEVWDPTTELFTRGPDLLRGRDAPALLATDGRVLIAGGRGEASLEAWTLDLATSEVVIASLPGGPRTGSDLVASEVPLLYLQGGLDAAGESAPPVWIDLDVQSAGLSLPGVPFVRGGRAVRGSLDGTPDEVYVVTGRLQDELFDHLARARFTDTALVELEPPTLAIGREQAAVVAVPGGILVAGGTNQGFAVETVELVSAFGSTPCPSLVVARSELIATPLAGGAVLFSGGLDDQRVPVAVVELLLPPGSSGPDADALFARAAMDRARREALEAEVARLEGEVRRLGGELARTQDALRVTQDERTAAEALVKQREAELAQAQAQVAQLQQQLAAAQANAQTSAAQLASLQGQVNAANANASRIDTELRTSQARLADVTSRLAATQAELDFFKREKARLEAELAAARAPAPKPKVITGGAKAA